MGGGLVSLTIHPGQATGSVRAPGSKSVTHRALMLAAVANGGTIHGPLWSQDTLATLDGIRAMGLKVIATNTEAVIRGGQLGPAAIDCRNSGTTLRLLTAIAATLDGTSTLSGDASLETRPMGPLAEALEQLGAEVTCHGKDGRPPVEVTGPADGGTARIQGDVSSQFISGLLLAGIRMPQGTEVELTTELTSRPYAELTARMMQEIGVEVETTENGFTVDPADLGAVRLTVPGDYSAAAFPLVAGALTGGELTVHGLIEDSGQGDEALLEILETFGCRLERDGDSVTLVDADLAPAEVDLGDHPDLFPPLAVLATGCTGKTVLHGAPHLRHKESDRITAMVEGLTALGAKVQARDDGATIEGSSLTGGVVEAHDDHRIQMALAVAALTADAPVTIEGPADVHAVSYPRFTDHLRDLGIEVDVQEDETA